MDDLIWKEKLNGYHIYHNDIEIGHLKTKFGDKRTIGDINNQQYVFFKPKTLGYISEIINPDTNQKMGEIVINGLKSTVQVNIEGKQFYWQSNSWKGTSAISDNLNNRVDFKTGFTKGHIETNTSNALMILLGLYVKQQNTNWFVIFFPIIIAFYVILFA